MPPRSAAGDLKSIVAFMVAGKTFGRVRIRRLAQAKDIHPLFQRIDRLLALKYCSFKPNVIGERTAFLHQITGAPTRVNLPMPCGS